MKIQNESLYYDSKIIKDIVEFTMPLLLREILEGRYVVYNAKLDFKIKVCTTFKDGSIFDGNYGLVGRMSRKGSTPDYLKLSVEIFEPSISFLYPFREGMELLELAKMGGSTGDYIGTLMLSREEALVHGMAHELRHVWQFFTKDIWDELSKEQRDGLDKFPGDGSDYDADRYAMRKMREWRRMKNQPLYQQLVITD